MALPYPESKCHEIDEKQHRNTGEGMNIAVADNTEGLSISHLASYSAM